MFFFTFSIIINVTLSKSIAVSNVAGGAPVPELDYLQNVGPCLIQIRWYRFLCLSERLAH